MKAQIVDALMEEVQLWEDEQIAAGKSVGESVGVGRMRLPLVT